MTYYCTSEWLVTFQYYMLFYLQTGGDPLGQFAIGHVQDEWKVSVRKPLDREVTDNYLLNITASDGIFTAKAVVEVKVLDANDNDPICKKVKFAFFFSNSFFILNYSQCTPVSFHICCSVCPPVHLQ